jgi:hypothetical protein
LLIPGNILSAQKADPHWILNCTLGAFFLFIAALILIIYEFLMARTTLKMNDKSLKAARRPGLEARDASGRPCDPLSEAARAWCAQGAILKTAGELGFDRDDAQAFLDHIARDCTGSADGLMLMNDMRGYFLTIHELLQTLLRLGGQVTDPLPGSVRRVLDRLAATGRPATRRLPPKRVHGGTPAPTAHAKHRTPILEDA